jgi:L,D-transpeptidase YcbB
VPVRIQHGELKRRIQSDPGYLKRHGYRLRTIKGGEQRLAQAPGRGNALGSVKILFPNRHSVYLHDTPMRAAFSRSRRALSHGCVRVHQPIRLAVALLEADSTMQRSKVERIVRERKESVLVELRKPVPVVIEYNTVAFAPDSERPVFLDDIYGYDAAYHRGKLPYTYRQRKQAAGRAKKRARQPELSVGCQ